MKQCIDISAWQGEVSVGTLMKSGIPAIVLRSSYTSQKGFSLHKDKVFDHNIKNAYKAGMKDLGIYHYSQAISETEAIREARFVIDTASKYRTWITLPIWFDWEFGGRLNAGVARTMGKQRCRQICDAFCRTIRQAGYKAGVYANLSTLGGYIADDLYKSWPIWVAQYARKCDYKHPYMMWQYSSSGKVAGIPGRIDMNYLYGADDVKPHGKTYSGRLPALPHRGWFTSGDKGEQVKLLQKFLNWYFGYQRLAVDGEVGRLTMNAVKDYQRNEGLHVDGAFGSESLKHARIVRR